MSQPQSVFIGGLLYCSISHRSAHCLLCCTWANLLARECSISENITILIKYQGTISFHRNTVFHLWWVAFWCRWSLEVLLASLKKLFPRGGEKSVFVEYVMLKGVNDLLEDAERLVTLLDEIECKINLIGFNAHEGTRFVPSPEHQILAFRYKASSLNPLTLASPDILESSNPKIMNGLGKNWLKPGRGRDCPSRDDCETKLDSGLGQICYSTGRLMKLTPRRSAQGQSKVEILLNCSDNEV